MPLIHLYLTTINAAAFFLMLADKRKARKGLWRIPKKTLLGTAVIGGSIGAIAGMYLFRHKTRHLRFRIGLPVILVVQFLIAYLLR